MRRLLLAAFIFLAVGPVPGAVIRYPQEDLTQSAAARALGQAQVIAEMVTGFLLGPSLLGWLAPDVSAYLFRPDAMPIVYGLAQIALTLYMFTVGLEFESGLLKRSLKQAAAVSLTGILAPFALGVGAAIFLHRSGGFFAPALSAGQAAGWRRHVRNGREQHGRAIRPPGAHLRRALRARLDRGRPRRLELRRIGRAPQSGRAALAGRSTARLADACPADGAAVAARAEKSRARLYRDVGVDHTGRLGDRKKIVIARDRGPRFNLALAGLSDQRVVDEEGSAGRYRCGR